MLHTLKSRRGMVVAPHHLAAQAGLAILREGGNAVEAMVAAAAAIAVTYPHMNSIGGDGFWLIASARIWKGVPQDAQQVMQKHFNAAAIKQRADIVQANADYQKTLESKGLTFNTTQAEAFQAALAKTSFYKDAKAKFGDEGWTLLQKYAGNIG